MFEFSLYFVTGQYRDATLRDPGRNEDLRRRLEEWFKGCSLDHQPGSVIVRFRRETPEDLVEETERLDALIRLTCGKFGPYSLGRVDVTDHKHDYQIATILDLFSPSLREALLIGLARAYVDARNFMNLAAPAFS